MSTTIRILDAATGHVLTDATHPETHVRDVVAALRDVTVSTPVNAIVLRQPPAVMLAKLEPAELDKLLKAYGTPPLLPIRSWQGKSATELADQLETQCDKLSTPEGITATIEGLAMELAMFGNLVAMYLVTVRHDEENGQHLLKSTNTLRIMDSRLVDNPAAVGHLRASIANSVEFVRDALDRQLGKPSGNTLVGPDGALLP